MTTTKHYEVNILEVETTLDAIPFSKKKQIYDFKGDLKKFDLETFGKRINDIVDTKYIMRCCLAAFCYGAFVVYVRAIF